MKEIRVGRICKVTAIIIFVLGSIGGLMLFDTPLESFVITIILANFIFCLILYALGEIVDQLVLANKHLSIISSNSHTLVSAQKRTTPEMAATPKSYAIKTPANAKSVPSVWQCKNCGESNSGTSKFCQSCGTSK